MFPNLTVEVFGNGYCCSEEGYPFIMAQEYCYDSTVVCAQEGKESLKIKIGDIKRWVDSKRNGKCWDACTTAE